MRPIRKATMLVSACVVACACLVVLAMAAFACTSLATISLDRKAGTSLESVSGSGNGFSATGSQVQVHFNTRSGALLWSGRPDVNGQITFDFKIPQSEPGNYPIIATQNDATGAPVYGTPARTSLEVLASQPQGTSGNAPAPPQPQPAAAAPAPAHAAAQAPAPNRPAAAVPPAASAAQVPAPAPAPAVAPAPALVPGGAAAHTPMPAVSAPDRSDSSSVLGLVLIGAGLLLTVVAVPATVALRRSGGFQRARTR